MRPLRILLACACVFIALMIPACSRTPESAKKLRVAFVTNNAGVSWDVRRFQSFRDEKVRTGFGEGHLSFWRATMAVVIRY